jgi:uncharacterized protein
MKTLLALLTVVIATYVLLLAWLYFNQRALIFPGSMTKGTAEAGYISRSLHPQTVLLRTTSGIKVVAYLLPPSRDRRPDGTTLLFFYGNGTCMSGCWYIAEQFRKFGCSVMLVDYPGYGLSAGQPSESGCYEASDAAYQYLADHEHVSPNRIIAAGWSLGSSVAIHLAATKPVGGLITLSAFTSMSDMAASQYPFVPKFINQMLLKYKFDNIHLISRVCCPIFIAHGMADSFIPPTMSEQLAMAAHAPVTVDWVPGASHSDIFSNGGSALFNPLGNWIAKV